MDGSFGVESGNPTLPKDHLCGYLTSSAESVRSIDTIKALPLTVILIEDDAGHARLIERHLRRTPLQHTLVILHDSDSALHYFFPPSSSPRRRMTPCVVLLDLQLAGRSGLQLLARLKSAPQTRAMPVIVFSTSADPDTIAACYALGCNAYLTKPVDAGQFRALIQALGAWLAHIAIPSGPS
jgi:CheY-like chemotaxis protein